MLAVGISESQFRMIQELRANIYELHDYLVEQDVICSVSHPLYRVNGRLTIDHIEKLILMFSRFEAINGARARRGQELVEAVLRNLTPEMIAAMADRHGIEPTGVEPWKKRFTGGSDDHSGVYIARPYTATPFARDVAEFLAHLRRGDHKAGRLVRRLRVDGAQFVPHRLRILQGPLFRGRWAANRASSVNSSRSFWKATASSRNRRVWAGASSAGRDRLRGRPADQETERHGAFAG